MAFEDRWYQEDGVNAIYEDIISDEEVHPIGVFPTASGKSVILCKLIDKYLSDFPYKDVLVISHVADILEQNYSKLIDYFSEISVGLYSAELNSRTVKKITVAGIQSIYKKPNLFLNVGLVIIDEAHLINGKTDTGRYRKFLNKLDAVYCGLTATPFRLGQGYIYKNYPGINHLFNKLSYDLSSYENYNKLVEQGYLSPLIPAPVDFVMDDNDIVVSNGDYDISDLSLKYDREEITKRIIDNVVKYAKNKYKKWLLFAIDIEHAMNIEAELLSRGITCKAIHSNLKSIKKKTLEDYREGKIKAVINVNMLTTGLDIPEIDLIVILRKTKSPNFHVQVLGRGGRIANNKTHCLVLDFAGNIKEHGPINDVYVNEPGNFNSGGLLKRSKECDNCGTDNSLRAKECIACGEEFKINHNLNTSASNAQVIKGANQVRLESWAKVREVTYRRHTKQGSPDSIKVTYHLQGFQVVQEWVTPDHKGYYGAKGKLWIKNRWRGAKEAPITVDDFLQKYYLIDRPLEIFVDFTNKFPEIKDYMFDENPNLPVKPKILESFNSGVFDANGNELFDDDIPF